ncbi:MAG: LytR/AlgR family response regulator transcription factor, partial [Ruminococcus sp.]
MHWNRVVIYDDVKSFAEELKNMLQLILADTEIIAVNNSEDAVSAIDGCDLLMLDIGLENGNDGIEFLKKLKNRQDLSFQTVFISGYLHNVERVFEVEADGYLIKPVTMSRLKLCLQRLSRKVKRDTMLVPVKKGVLQVSLEKVLFAENISRHVKFCNEDGTEIISTSRFADLEESVPEYFCRCHNSFYVNLHHVTSLKRYVFTMDNGCEIPVSQSRYS